jgi:hypothetical protein
MAHTSSLLGLGLSYHPSLIWEPFKGWQCGKDSAANASFFPIRFEEPSPDPSAANIASLSGTFVLDRWTVCHRIGSELM